MGDFALAVKCPIVQAHRPLDRLITNISRHSHTKAAAYYQGTVNDTKDFGHVTERICIILTLICFKSECLVLSS